MKSDLHPVQSYRGQLTARKCVEESEASSFFAPAPIIIT